MTGAHMETDWHKNERRRILAMIARDRYKGEPMREAMTRYIARLEGEAAKVRVALQWAHGFISNTDKPAADKLLEKAGMMSYGEKWFTP